ncbi:MAG TPA: LamG domain-containing protein, partial [Sphingobacteriaceae bacterium]
MFQISFQKPRILSWKVIIALLFLALLTTGTIVYSLEATSQTLSLEESRLIVTSGDADSAEQIQSPTFELTSINLPSTRLPNYIPTDIPREAAGAVIEQNYIAYDDLGEEGYRFQGTRVFRTNATLDEEFNRYLAYFNSRNYQILTTSNQPDFKSIFVRPAPTSSIFGSININRNTITNIRSVDITFQNNNFSCSTPPSGLISWYYGEGNANDSFGVNNGILRNGATATGTGSAGHGLAFGFDGVDDYVEIPDSSSLKPQQISVEAWVKFTSLNSTNPSAPGLQYIVFKKNRRADHFEGYSLSKFRDTNGVERIGFTIASAGGNQISARSTSPVTVNANIRNQFYHLVGTYDGSTVRLYVNGELEGIQAANFALDYDTRPLFIGGSGESFNGRMQGVIDEVGIYNRAVTANEVRRIFESGGAGKCRQIP